MEERRGSVTTRELFTKALTATDISKNHNRLIIPKVDAEKFFPEVKKYDSEGKPMNGDGMRLQFWERVKEQWLEFRYCFWISTKSYVLTTKWYQFVADYSLKTKDAIKFYECEEIRGEERWAYFMIDIVRYEEEKIGQEAMKVKNREMIGFLANQKEIVDIDNKGVEEEKVEEEAMEVENKEMIDFFAPRETIDDSNKEVSEEKVQEEAMEVENTEMFDFFPTKEKENDSGDHEKGIKLFGVHIKVDDQKGLKLFGVCIKG